jgi:hypothetical protein
MTSLLLAFLTPLLQVRAVYSDIACTANHASCYTAYQQSCQCITSLLAHAHCRAVSQLRTGKHRPRTQPLITLLRRNHAPVIICSKQPCVPALTRSYTVLLLSTTHCQYTH